MKKKLLILFILPITFLMAFQANAQKFMTKNGHIRFFSETPLETIQADNQQVNAALDVLTGELVFKVLMKSFQFEKALMQEHFNENYVESHKFPNSIFQGKVTNIDQFDIKKQGTFEAIIEGELNLHGVTQKITEKGTLTVEGDMVKGYSRFNIKPADYDIKIPKAVINNIAEVIEVTVEVELNKL
jgi:hypothetical protein